VCDEIGSLVVVLRACPCGLHMRMRERESMCVCTCVCISMLDRNQQVMF